MRKVLTNYSDTTVTVVLGSHRRSRRTLGATRGTLSDPAEARRQALARRLAADWHDGQYSASLGPQISGLTPAVPFRQEGRSRVVTNVGWDVVDARASARKCGSQGELNLVSGLQACKTNDALAYGKTVWS